ncbi:O-Antigen ligase [compost metagenome]
MNKALRLPFNTSRFLLAVMALYLCLGNLPRVIPLPGFSDNLAISEFLVFLLAPLVALSQGRLIRCLKFILPLLLVIGFSFAWGTFLNGFDPKSAMYAARLGLQLLVGSIVGDILYRRYQADTRRGLQYFLGIYLVLLFLGAGIFVLFPESARLWAFLSSFGVTFLGDPHVYRFYSTYFDPNFYAAIALIPVLISTALHGITRQSRYHAITALFVVSILLSGSRSGIATAIAMVVLLNLGKLRAFVRLKVSRRAMTSLLLGAFAFIALSPIYLNSVLRVLGRMVGMQEDGSALQRLKSFMYGLEVFSEHPLLGVGYNYLDYRAAIDVGSQKLDSSLLYLCTNFGLILTWILLVLALLWIVNVARLLPKQAEQDPHTVQLFWSLLVYLVVCLLFTSQFNNLIVYQFWLIPMVVIFVYLTKWAKAGPSLSRVASPEGLSPRAPVA